MRLSKHFLRAVQDEYMHISPRPSRLLGVWVQSQPIHDNNLQGEFSGLMATPGGVQVIELVLNGWVCDEPIIRDQTNLGIFQALHGWEKSQLKDRELRERAQVYTNGPMSYEMHQEIQAEYAKACKDGRQHISIMAIAVSVQEKHRKVRA